MTLPAVPYGNPITYLHAGRQYIVVAIGGGGGAAPPELIALALPGGCAPAKAGSATSRLTNETVFVDTGSPSSCAR